MDLVQGKGITDVLVMGGGIIPDGDIPPSKDVGIAEKLIQANMGCPPRPIINFRHSVAQASACGLWFFERADPMITAREFANLS
jgi:hypothetical protein